MANINRVVLVGNLTKDPELRHTPSGTAVCSLRIAVNSRRRDETGQWVDKPNYFDVSIFGNQAESSAQYLSKGRPVGIDGRLDWREWEAQDGSKRQAVSIIAESVQFLGGRGDDPRAAAAAATSSCRRARPRRRPTSRRPQTTTSPSRSRRATRENTAAAEASAGRCGGGGQAPQLLLLQGQDRRDRLQERQPAAPVHLREGEDPQPPHHGRVQAAPGAGRDRP